MKQHSMIVPAAAAVLLAAGCQSPPPAASDAQISRSSAYDAKAFPADRTATLWVKGLGCPY